MTKKNHLLTAAAAVVLSSNAAAALIAADDFDYRVGALNGANGGPGWTSAWSATAVASVVDPANDLSGDRSARFGGNDNNAAVRTIATFSGADLFISFRFQLPTGTQASLNDFLGVWLDLAANAGNQRPNIGIKADRGNTSPSPLPRDDVFVRTNGSGGAFVAGSDLDNDRNYRVVGHLSRTAPGNYNRFDVWLDPLLADLASPDASHTGNTGIASVTHVGVRTANLDTGDQVLVDDLVLATTWNEAMGVPEPGVLGLLGMSLLGFGIARARR